MARTAAATAPDAGRRAADARHRDSLDDRRPRLSGPAARRWPRPGFRTTAAAPGAPRAAAARRGGDAGHGQDAGADARCGANARDGEDAAADSRCDANAGDGKDADAAAYAVNRQDAAADALSDDRARHRQDA